MKPDISIIVTNYNKTPDQIEDCFQSIRDQTVRPKEVIFVDDCSTDPHAYTGVLSIVLPRNSGVAVARDVGVKMSVGKLLLFVDADDKLNPDFLEQCGKVIVESDIAYPNVLTFGMVDKNELVTAPETLEPTDLMNRKCPLVVTSMMHRRVYESLGGFKQLPVYEDWDFWIRAMCNGYTFARANTLLWYRQTLQSRNTVSSDVRTDVYDAITAPYTIQKGKICLKQKDSK